MPKAKKRHKAIKSVTSSDHKTTPLVCTIDHDAPDTPPKEWCRICNPTEADKALAERKAHAEKDASVVPDPDVSYRVISNVKHINIHLNDELPRIGSGMRPFLMWQTHNAKGVVTTHLYYVTRLIHEKLNDRRWTDIQKCRHYFSKDGKWNPDGIANALEANLSKAVQWSWQVSQKNAQLVIAMLRTGKKPEELELEDDSKLSGSPEGDGGKKVRKVTVKEKKPKVAKVRKPVGNIPEKGHIVISKDAKPRKEGTKAGARNQEMQKYVKAHPKASWEEVLEKTSYRIDDLKWDIEAGNIEVVK